MIKFFRHIRQHMIKEDRALKYLLYALGEVVLVVIGILIAVQLNGVKEQRARNAQEHAILTEMLSNLRMDSLDMAGNIDRNMKVLNAANAVIRQLDERIPWNDSMAYHYGHIGSGSLVAPVLSSYENMKSVGFDLIRNDSLRSMIHKLYAQQYPFVVRLEQEHGTPMWYSVVKPQLLKKVIRIPQGGRRPLDLEALWDDNEFKEAIRTMKGAQELLIHFYDRLLQLDLQLMRMIEKELKAGA